MLADFIRKTKIALAKTDVSSKHTAVSAPHQHTHTYSLQYPHKTTYRKQYVRYIIFTVRSHCSSCLQ